MNALDQKIRASVVRSALRPLAGRFIAGWLMAMTAPTLGAIDRTAHDPH